MQWNMGVFLLPIGKSVADLDGRHQFSSKSAWQAIGGGPLPQVREGLYFPGAEHRDPAKAQYEWMEAAARAGCGNTKLACHEAV